MRVKYVALGMDRVQPTTSDTNEALLCRHCGYRLRGIDGQEVCPECGTAVAESLRADVLAHADPEWLRKIFVGQRNVVTACVVMLIAIPCMLALDIWFDDELDGKPMLRRIIESVPALLFLFFFLVGALRVAAQEPRLRESEPPRTVRRVALMAAAAAGPLTILYYAFGSRELRLVLALAVYATVTLLTVHIGRLAGRIPDQKLESRCVDSAKGFGVLVAVTLLCSVWDMLLGSNLIVDLVGGLAGLGMFAYTIELYLCWRLFRKQLTGIIAEPLGAVS